MVVGRSLDLVGRSLDHSRAVDRARFARARFARGRE